MFAVPAGKLNVAVPAFNVKLERLAPEIGMERGLVPGSALMMAASTTPHIWDFCLRAGHSVGHDHVDWTSKPQCWRGYTSTVFSKGCLWTVGG